MKSSLEGRNNMLLDPLNRRLVIPVSMKSGLEGRNNRNIESLLTLIRKEETK